MRSNEKALLRLFLGVYLVSTFIMITVILWLLYDSKIQSLKENERLKMQEFTGRLAGEIIDAAMMHRKPQFKRFNTYKYTLYDKNKTPIMGSHDNRIKWQETYYMSSGESLYVSLASKGHLGIYYIVAEDLGFEKEKKIARWQSIGLYVASLIGMFVMAWILTKIFLRPIRQKVEALNQFVKDSTHELNTPIASLLLTIESLEKKPDNQTAINRLKLLGKKISHLYSDLVFTQLQSNQTQFDTAVSFKLLTESLLDFFEPLAKQKHIDLLFKCDYELTYTMNQEAAARLISNLISNAIKYTARNGKVTVSCHKGIFQVCDTGIGIDEKRKAEIFQRYHRLDTVQGGFGIGLDIVMQVCKKYHIKLDLVSKPREGSCFSLRFPKS